MSDDEKLDLLASDGMLVKRPLAISGEKITLGFKEDQYKRYLVIVFKYLF